MRRRDRAGPGHLVEYSLAWQHAAGDKLDAAGDKLDADADADAAGGGNGRPAESRAEQLAPGHAAAGAAAHAGPQLPARRRKPTSATWRWLRR